MKSPKAFPLSIATALLITAFTGTVEAASPFKKVNGGTIHVPSGVVFPRRVGVFQFASTTVYGSGGRDAGAKYNVGLTIRGNVYIYPLGTYGKDFNAELRVQESAITKLNQAVKLVSQSSFTVSQGGRTISGTRVQYELTRSLWGGKAQRCGSQLYLFRDSSWLIQARFSYPIEQSRTADREIGDFFRLWQWRAPGNLVRSNQFRGDGRGS